MKSLLRDRIATVLWRGGGQERWMCAALPFHGLSVGLTGDLRPTPAPLPLLLLFFFFLALICKSAA